MNTKLGEIMKHLLKEYWYDMIKIKSITGEEKDIGNYIKNKLENFGLIPKLIYDAEDTTKNSPTIYTYLNKEKATKTIMLIGHLDTVKVASGWETDPFTPYEIEDKTYGLGAMDMKGGLAAILGTAKYFSENIDKLNVNLLFVFVSDEENLSKGTYRFAEEKITADVAIMAECRYDNVAIGFRGRYSIDVIVHGKAAHASNYPNVGESAVLLASKLSIAIESIDTYNHEKIGKGTWIIRHIEGGEKNALIVPEKCTLFVDRYTVPGETFEVCKNQILDAANKIGVKNLEVSLRPRKSAYMEPFALSENNTMLLNLLDSFEKINGYKLKIAYDKSVCDSNILVNSLGIPTLTFGPSGENMHGANEYGHLDQIIKATEIYIDIIKKTHN